MNQNLKKVFTYFIIIISIVGVVRIYDWATKKPVPVDRTEDPRITELNKKIDAVLDSVSADKKKSAIAMENFYLSLDSVKNYRKTAINERKKLKATPDSMLNHRKDSILRANGIR